MPTVLTVTPSPTPRPNPHTRLRPASPQVAHTAPLVLTRADVQHTNTYQRGIKISDKDMKAFEARHVQRHEFHGNWNYVIKAAPDQDSTRPNQQK